MTFISFMLLNSILLTLFKHPLTCGLILLSQTILTTMITGLMNYNFWYSYILFLIMIGGMLVLFIYMTSIASNEKFKFNNKVIIWLTIFFLVFWMLNMNMTTYNTTTKMYVRYINNTTRRHNTRFLIRSVKPLFWNYMCLFRKDYSGPIFPSPIDRSLDFSELHVWLLRTLYQLGSSTAEMLSLLVLTPLHMREGGQDGPTYIWWKSKSQGSYYSTILPDGAEHMFPSHPRNGVGVLPTRVHVQKSFNVFFFGKKHMGSSISFSGFITFCYMM